MQSNNLGKAGHVLDYVNASIRNIDLSKALLLDANAWAGLWTSYLSLTRRSDIISYD